MQTNAHYWKTFLPFLPLFILAAVLSAWSGHTAHAATLTVTNLNDSGSGSLRQTIADANSGDTIDFSVSGTIVLSSELVITESLTIVGGDAVTVSGNNATRVFNVAGGNVTFAGLHIISGTVTTDDCGDFTGLCGGGIMIQNSTVAVTVTNSIVAGNLNSKDGGGIFNFQGSLTVNNSTISNNSAVGSGGGIYNYEGSLTISHSTLSGNSESNNGGGIFNYSAGGDCIAPPAVRIHNSTLSGNSSGKGGGIQNSNGVMEITHSTITANSAPSGSGIWSWNDSDTCTRVGHTIIAGNSADGGDVAAERTAQRFYSLGYNLIGTAGTKVDFTQEFTAGGDQTAVADPDLAAPADNGGPTLTHTPHNGSPALNAGDTTCGAATDQRGVQRPQDGACEIGAYEQWPVSAGVSNTTTVSLNWSTVTAGCVYDLYEDTAPDFQSPTIYSGETPPYDILNRAGDPAVNYYFFTRATCGDLTVDSQTVGVFDFAVTPGD